jgi:IMP dehydrogenase
MSGRVGWDEKVGPHALAFDDVLLVPAYSAVHPRDVDVSTRFSRRIGLGLPLVSAAMDTVTGAELAIALAREGGIGVIHKNLSIEDQCGQVARVKAAASERAGGAGGGEGPGRGPLATTDPRGRLRVAAAVGTGGEALERGAELVRAGVDALVVDSAHAHSAVVLAAAATLRERFPDVDLVVGNVGTAEGARAVADLGADAVRVGMGAGAICTTRVVAGAGMAQVTAILEAAQALEGRDLAILADGGVRYSGDLVKALAAGGHAVMIGRLFAGTTESPGEVVTVEGRTYKAYRGMGSLGAMVAARGSRERYFQPETEEPAKLVPEGIEGRVPFRGPLSLAVFQLIGGLRAGMGYCGVRTIEELRTRTRFVRVSPAGLRESHPHDMLMIEDAPNYGVSGEG